MSSLICPVCNKESEEIAHAYDHIRQDEAYGIYAYELHTARSTLVLHPIQQPLTRPQIWEMRKKLGKWEQLIYGTRLRILEQSQVRLRWKAGGAD